MSAESPIATALVQWHVHHGRHSLPWQREPNPYRVWVSEIMLQQTQVVTVIGYYERFMQRFPDVAALAAAPLDEVLHLWSGLGYYSRARNLYRAAQRVLMEWGGELPTQVELLSSLPGIGRSTAGAILALGSDLPHPILDGNAKRVLARYFAVEGPTAARATEQQLWGLAERCTPKGDVAAYTQAIMDLGATLCTRRNPLCKPCPLSAGCAARQSGRQHELPAPRIRAARRTRRIVLLLALRIDGQVLLQRRPEQGVWGGLWSPPEFDTAAAALAYGARILGTVPADETLPMLRHSFTHFDLEMTPLIARCGRGVDLVQEPAQQWYDLQQPARIGLPAPISTLLAQLR